MKLRDFPTLRHVVKFVYDSRPDLAPAARPLSESEKAEKTAATARGADGPAPTPAPLPFEEKVLVAPAPAPPAADDVVQKVLAIVAEKTGYPAEMLELDLDLEADLGVDTVKQAETFAAVRAEWDIPRQDSMKLRDFPTLRHVVKFVYDHRPDLAPDSAAARPAAAPVPAAVPPPAAAPAPKPVAASLEDADRVPRRVPVPSLRPRSR